ncbi:E3 ubiquitin-protein ligase ZNF598-like [Populus alba x Populus x berolinensis]|uniref:RING-type E3 ubiquitin transferase n=1 Tax=Populus alba x Populus x berolinensis TaxID=444605 RepID=A0AAD6WCU9_9ROSI|nr:E3 ubiquitin-protein ligase ZNF598-like [Populus alba x Populus x berolinensis]
MDDSCAVCAEALEWVAYGACGHRDVCSTCVSRLRFICDDRRCCICKTESSVVFVTKALGDYTRMINDFLLLPPEPKEGRMGSYWYHEDTQAFFDDVDHYKMIKAMCRLSCSVCDKEESNDGSKRRGKFRNINQLKGHLFHQHKLHMCSLCLEGRKVFICEQKLYSRAQLNQHISTGDSEVDGSESERGGFMGHPMCEFCKKPFYGDNELYTHMSTEHYTCHLCQRQHPGQYEYYKNYDDLEIHFRRDHFLCDDEGCLAKKFIVFQTEAELKRHNTIEHAGHMSRSQRNAALQIPTSFRYRQSNEQGNRHGRGRTFRLDQADNQLSIAIQASLETAHSESTSRDRSSSAQAISDHVDLSDIDPIVQPFESLTATDPETTLRYLQALGPSSWNAPLQESSFPPLFTTASSGQQQAKDESESLPNNTMATHLRRQNNRNATVINSPQQWPAASRGHVSSNPALYRPTLDTSPLSSRSSASGPGLSNYASSIQSHAQTRPAAVRGHPSASSVGSSGTTSRISSTASTSNVADSGSLKPSISDFPPVSAVPMHKMPTSSQVVLNVEEFQTANKSLVEKIRAALENDEDRYTLFKDISGQYRQGSIDTGEYLDYVQQFGLSRLIPELARLCPDAQKQKELVETYNASLRSSGKKENGWGRGSAQLKGTNGSKEGKGIAENDCSSKDRLTDSFINTVRALQSNYKPVEDEAQLLSKDGYRAAKGKSSVMLDEREMEPRIQNGSLSAGDGSSKNLKDGGREKQRKKTSKFQRARLGDGSMAALLDLQNSEPDPRETVENRIDDSSNSVGGLPVRGVWRKGGGQKLFP